jgi:hypothetical protein
MEMNVSWEAASCAATQKFPKIYGPRRFIAMVRILNQMNPVHSNLFYPSKIYLNIIHPPTSWSSKWPVSFWLSDQYPICTPFLPFSLYLRSFIQKNSSSYEAICDIS